MILSITMGLPSSICTRKFDFQLFKADMLYSPGCSRPLSPKILIRTEASWCRRLPFVFISPTFVENNKSVPIFFSVPEDIDVIFLYFCLTGCKVFNLLSGPLQKVSALQWEGGGGDKKRRWAAGGGEAMGSGGAWGSRSIDSGYFNLVSLWTFVYLLKDGPSHTYNRLALLVLTKG
jgi:hypothetical protein